MKEPIDANEINAFSPIDLRFFQVYGEQLRDGELLNFLGRLPAIAK